MVDRFSSAVARASTTDDCVWGTACACTSGRGVAGGCHIDRNESITRLSA